MVNIKPTYMSIRNKNHMFWRILFAIANAVDTGLIGLVAFIKCVFVLPFFILIILFAANAPKGAMETGQD